MLNIGFNPTFNQKKLSIEVHIFDFEKDIYNKKIKVFLVKKIRDEKRFLSKEALKKQLLKDQNISAKYLMS